jgi:integrase
MAIIKRNNRYQVKMRDSDGKWMVQAAATRKDAEQIELEWKSNKSEGYFTRLNLKITVDEYKVKWFESVNVGNSQSGWRVFQAQYYRDFIGPVIGHLPLKNVTPADIQNIFVEMTKLKKAPQTQRLVYATVRKMFGDAVENFQYLTMNPVLKKLQPVVPEKEAPHLNLKQLVTLLKHVKGEKYGVAIWLQTYLGLRVSELQAMQWSDIDLDTGMVTIRRAFVRKTNVIRDYPKGKKQHTHSIPLELVELLKAVKPEKAEGFVVSSPEGKGLMLPYRWYNHAIKQYCKKLDLPRIGTHGLRHSASQLYLSHGANKEDLRELFAHSGMKVTERYIHGHHSNLQKVAKVIRLF